MSSPRCEASDAQRPARSHVLKFWEFSTAKNQPVGERKIRWKPANPRAPRIFRDDGAQFSARAVVAPARTNDTHHPETRCLSGVLSRRLSQCELCRVFLR